MIPYNYLKASMLGAYEDIRRGVTLAAGIKITLAIGVLQGRVMGPIDIKLRDTISINQVNVHVVVTFTSESVKIRIGFAGGLLSIDK